MIPKKLHYVWIGEWDNIPDIEKEWFETSKKNNPDFEVKIWSEKDVPMNPFMENCLSQKLWWAAADYIRTWVMVNEGGIYLDTDVELIKPIPEKWLHYSTLLPRETPHYISNYFIGSSKNNRFFKSILEMYDSDDGTQNPLDVRQWVPPESWAIHLDKVYGRYNVRYPSDAAFKGNHEVKMLTLDEMCPYYPWDLERVDGRVVTTNSIGIHYWNNYKKENNLELTSFSTKFFDE